MLAITGAILLQVTAFLPPAQPVSQLALRSTLCADALAECVLIVPFLNRTSPFRASGEDFCGRCEDQFNEIYRVNFDKCLDGEDDDLITYEVCDEKALSRSCNYAVSNCSPCSFIPRDCGRLN